MLWVRPLTMLRLLTLLMLCELVRTGFFVSALPVGGPALGLGTAAIGLLTSAHYLGDALSKGPCGLLTERWGLGRILLLGTLLGVVAVAGTRVLPHPVWGVLACAAWGVTYAALWPGVMSASQSLSSPGRTARALAVSNVVVAPAILLGALGVGPLMQARTDLGWTLLIAAQGAAVVLALSLLPLRLPRQDVLAGSVWKGWSRVAALFPAAFVQTLAPGLLITILYPLLDQLKLSLNDLLRPGALALAIFGLSLWGAGRLADREHPRRALLPGLLLLAATFGLAALPDVQRHLWPLAVLLGAGYGAFVTGWNGLVARTLPEGNRAAAWGTVMAVEALGYAIGPVLGGAAWQAAGQAGVFGLGALAFLVALGYDLLRRESPVAQPT
ncbi:MFS transporter [Deinococcus malanensis]|uniref:MFS transporter n=1 Tax=Deinococcus malanensis TaxID=1706855 RepID=A0ABQ2F0S8_9DEIO|nr:MFS transporter [Deinococcus malanensis]GGK31184.1 MFS transporter [Deinococcus malanensis]